MHVNTKISCSLALVGALFLFGCYREDASVLYSRQIVTAVSTADLKKLADSTNRQLNDIRILINNLQAKEPVSDVSYVKDSIGNDIGARITFGSKTVYVPFGTKGDKGADGKDGVDGKDGKDGVNGKDGVDGKTPAFTVGINEAGNWIVTIDGKTTDTGIPATGPKGDTGADGKDGVNGKDGENGKDGQSPIVGLVTNPDDANDTNLYWQISWPDGTKTILKDSSGNYVRANGIDGAKGDKGDQGIQGEPGVNSPIKNIVKNEDGTVTIETELNGLEKIKLPLYIKFEIFPEASKLVDGTVTGKDYSARWNSTTEELTFEPGETISFKYKYTTDDDLKSIIATVPYKWSFDIDQVNKTIAITAPSKTEALVVADHKGVIPVTAMTEAGDAYTRYIKVVLPKRMYIDYFFAENSNVATYPSTSQYNEIKLVDNYSDYIHVQHRYDDGDSGYTYINGEANPHGTDATTMTSALHKKDYWTLTKADSYDYKKLILTDFIYPKNVNYIGLRNAASTPIKPNDYSIGYVYANALIEETTNALHVKPVPRNLYAAYTKFNLSGGSDHKTVHLRRLTQKIELHMADPAKELGLASGESFDISKLTLYHYATFRQQRLDDGGFQFSFSGGKGIVVKATPNSQDVTMTYDDKTNRLDAEFYTFPTQYSELFILHLEYTKADGTVAVKYLSNRMRASLLIPGGGGSLRYYYGVLNPSANAGNLRSISAQNASGTVMSSDVYLDNGPRTYYPYR